MTPAYVTCQVQTDANRHHSLRKALPFLDILARKPQTLSETVTVPPFDIHCRAYASALLSTPRTFWSGLTLYRKEKLSASAGDYHRC